MKVDFPLVLNQKRKERRQKRQADWNIYWITIKYKRKKQVLLRAFSDCEKLATILYSNEGRKKKTIIFSFEKTLFTV